MRLTPMRPRSVVLLAAACLAGGACVIVSTSTTQRLVDKASVGTAVESPVKAHLMDGGVIVFPNGMVVTNSMVSGAGQRLDAARRTASPNTGIPLDSVLGFEVYERHVNPVRTLVYGTASVAASITGIALLAAAIFGSCPTVYADSAGVQTLQAESFSYSIAPLLAKRDVDRMTVQPDSAGIIRLVVKNEALETHHLDQMEVVEVRHGTGELALPSPRGGAIVVSDIAGGATTRDGVGRDVSRLVARADESAFGTDDRLLDAAIAGGPTEDQLVITIPRRAGTDSVALVLRARSSLLTTSVLYEHLMGRQGAKSLDWMGRDLSRITTLAKLASWYGSNFGMRVEVQDGARWRSVIRLMDFGPTAWRTVGVALPASQSPDDSVRVRLTFPADAFRIDQLSLARRVRFAEQRRIPIARAVDAEGKPRADIVSMLSRADERDVETHPGDHFTLEFDAGRDSAASARTFFFVGQGYYTEWLRPSWMRSQAKPEPFNPNAGTMRELLRSWKGGRDSLQGLFFSRRVPVA